MTRFRRLIGVALWHLGGEPSARETETQASLTLYPPSSRRTYAAPQKRPASGTNAAGLIPEVPRNDPDNA